MSEHAGKQDSHNKIRFLSLKWKWFIALSLSLLTLTTMLSWYFNQQYRINLSNRLAELRLEQLEALESTVYRTGEQLHYIVNSMLISISSDRLLTSAEVFASYQQHVESALPKLKVLWALEEVVLADNDATTQFHYRVEPETAAVLPTLIQTSGATAANVHPPVQIRCHSRCTQVLSFPIFEENQRIGNLFISRKLSSLAQQLMAKNNSQLFVFVNDSDKQTSEARANSAAVTYLPNWTGYLNHIQDEYSRVVQSASTLFQPNMLLGTSRHFEFEGRHYAITLLPIRGYEDLSLRYLLLRDISEEYRSLTSSLNEQIALISFITTLFTALLILLWWRHYKRIKQQLLVLPLLGHNKFSEVRNIVHKNRQLSVFKDEQDTLDDAVSTLSYQLESLDKAVSLRTREMERLSLFDTLTGLANRNLLQYELQSDVQRFQQQGGILAVVILDLDKFKRINDSIGHQLGDMLLGKVAARLKNATRSLGLIARLGGDEFAIILRSAKKLAQVEVLCQKIIELVRRPLELDGHSISISCSLGVALAGNKQNGNDMIKNAEIAMYKAKENGGNAYRMFNPNMASEAHANLSLEADIRRAFENREFTLFLQPKVDMDNQITGFEALIRWDHPDRGLVPPVEFIPAMENMGLISQLDNFVLDASCRQLKVLQTHYPDISIAVNISSTHFTDKNFLVFLKSCLDKYPINPNNLELEITETLLMENMNVGLEIIEQIKELGVRIAIDDFGTGYSSLSYLKKLPVDTIKIDREFIKDIPESESDMQISSVIIFLAKQLNFTVVAEGVETSEQLVFLKANQCDLAQGYLFSKPIPAHKAMILLESQLGGKKIGFA